MEHCSILPVAVFLQEFLILQVIAVSGSRLLGVGFRPSVHNEKLSKFNCPGVGNYPVPDNCAQFFHCFFPGHKPTSIFECNGYNMKFHHMSRKCEHGSIVDCKLCSNKSILKDKTSKHHFIKCHRGQIAERYKCPEGGEFQFKTMKCINVVHTMDLTHAVLDSPPNLAKFANKWKKAQIHELVQKSLTGKQKMKPHKQKQKF